MVNETFEGIWIVYLRFGRGIMVGESEEAVFAKLQLDYGSRDIDSIEPASIEDILGVRGMGGHLPSLAKQKVDEYRKQEAEKNA